MRARKQHAPRRPRPTYADELHWHAWAWVMYCVMRAEAPAAARPVEAARL